jgi:outer membrane protein assembly factor BamB
MADISLNQVASVLGSTTVSGMAQKMGLWPPPPAISVRDLVSSKCLTQHYDDARTGWNPFETTLTVANVPGLKKLFAQAVDGTIYAQPLYAHHVNVPGFGVRNVVFVATENDTVYAFDADTNVPPLWQRSLIPPGEQVVAVGDIEGCDNVAPVIGITSTPVINCAYTMWVVGKTKKVAGGSTTFHYRLYALDLTTGADRVAPVEIGGSVPGSSQPNDGHSHVVFDPHLHLNRPGLLLFNGLVYVGFGSHCDKHLGIYHGWVFAYNAATLAPVGVFATTPNTQAGATSAAGIWQSGMGLAADPEGFVYFTTGNGDFTANTPGGQDYGDTVIKLTPAMSVADYFTPSDQPKLLEQDIDLGSGGVLILPNPARGTSLPSVLVATGKDGTARVTSFVSIIPEALQRSRLRRPLSVAVL